jgi:lipoprotein-anchoring transpeptidase ErfK/SrfK
MRVEVHLSQRQVVLYRGKVAVKRYEIGVGRPGWETPTGTFRVLQMKRNPTWINPFTNEAVPAGDPRNPLQGYWIGFWTDGNNWVGFHGTLDSNTVGKAASHGCLHMHRVDLQDLFSRIRLGTPIIVVAHGEVNAGRGFTQGTGIS